MLLKNGEGEGVGGWRVAVGAAGGAAAGRCCCCEYVPALLENPARKGRTRRKRTHRPLHHHISSNNPGREEAKGKDASRRPSRHLTATVVSLLETHLSIRLENSKQVILSPRNWRLSATRSECSGPAQYSTRRMVVPTIAQYGTHTVLYSTDVL